MSILALIVLALAVWWLLVSYDCITKPLDQRTPPQPCPHCGMVEDEIGGSYRCPICRRTRFIYSVVDK